MLNKIMNLSGSGIRKLHEARRLDDVGVPVNDWEASRLESEAQGSPSDRTLKQLISDERGQVN